jgi:tetratricopeptide (TPR) repeat protein
MKSLRLVAMIVCAALVASSLHAEPTGAERALAERLFDEGRKLMSEERYDEACPKLEESQRIEPAGGTLLNLALCHERLGRTATAWSEFREALAYARRDNRADRESIALEHSQSLERLLPKLKLSVLERSIALELFVDGITIGAEARRAPIPLDPGEHRVEAKAPGKVSFDTRVAVAAGETKELEIPELQALPTPTVPAAVGPMPAPSQPEPRRDAPPPRAGGDGSAQRIIGYAVAGLGVAALAAGGYFGLDALSEDEKSDNLCPKSDCTNEDGVRHSKNARRSALIADVAFAAGGIALGAGAYVVITASPGGSKSAMSRGVGADPALGASFSGVW